MNVFNIYLHMNAQWEQFTLFNVGAIGKIPKLKTPKLRMRIKLEEVTNGIEPALKVLFVWKVFLSLISN